MPRTGGQSRTSRQTAKSRNQTTKKETKKAPQTVNCEAIIKNEEIKILYHQALEGKLTIVKCGPNSFVFTYIHNQKFEHPFFIVVEKTKEGVAYITRLANVDSCDDPIAASVSKLILDIWCDVPVGCVSDGVDRAHIIRKEYPLNSTPHETIRVTLNKFILSFNYFIEFEIPQEYKKKYMNWLDVGYQSNVMTLQY